ncbi:sperm-associated antigen 5 [Nerophis ophidion]|uniref:sperm-associated antigen 5 n=1 Tax=Nerophis ophidion TaxID=159077 RepID=UPI002AE03AE6|nr:sperm-associated antigen 5 [Nerophis ophidion]
MSSQSMEGSPSRRCVERLPLRSMENKESALKQQSKSLFNTTQGAANSRILRSPPSANFTQPIGSTTELTSYLLGDVTFKSFICSGGEVELGQSSLCVADDDGDHVVLREDHQSVSSNCEKDDSVASELVSSCDNHAEHPYCHPADANVYEAAVDLTWKSFACDGGEVEVLDATNRPLDATFLLPAGDLVQDKSINSSNLFEASHLGPAEEHVDHPYCNYECGEKSSGAVCDVTVGTFISSGGGVEIPDSAPTTEEILPLPADDVPIIPPDLSVLPAGEKLCSEHLELDGPSACVAEPCGQDPLNVDPFGQGTIGIPGEEQAVSSQLLQANEERLVIQKSSSPDFEVSCSTQASNEALSNDPFCFETPEILLLPADVVPILPQDLSVLPADGKLCSEHLELDAPSACVAEPRVQDPLNVDPFGQGTIGIPGEEQAVSSQLLQANEERLVIQKSSSPDFEVSCSTQASNQALSNDPFCFETPDLSHHDGSSPSHLGTATPTEDSEVQDSALGSSEDRPPYPNSADKPSADNLPDVLKVLSGCVSVALQLGEDSAHEKSLVAPGGPVLGRLWADILESPMPRPLFNSTTLCNKLQQSPVLQADEDFSKAPAVVPQSGLARGRLITEGPLQQQLQQMGEFLILASGKVGLNVSPPAAAPPVKSHNACVGSTPVKMWDQGLNTSGQFERKRKFSTADASSLTDPLLWNVAPGSLECLPKKELEQRLRSSMIMVEALVQQQAMARVHSHLAGPMLSEMRDKLVQTDHTELSQTTMYRDLYTEALNRIGDLEQDATSLQELVQCMQGMRVTMTSLASDTDAALSNMKHTEELVREDHSNLVSHYKEMKSLFTKSKEMQTRLMQKVKDALQQRDHMRTQMDGALTVKEAALSTVEQLRSHCADEIAALQRSVGSQQELLLVLNNTFPEQVALNTCNIETLNSASDLLRQTMQEQSSLMKELHDVRNLVHRTAPVLMKLNQKAADALRERDDYMLARDRALEDKEQLEDELIQTRLNLQAAEVQIDDLNLQVTILTSEMGVLRQKLTEHEEDSAQLERKVTEMSATLSSTLAAHTFLEHTLAEETSKLLQAQSDASQAQDMAEQLVSSLQQAEQRVEVLSQTLCESEEQFSRLHALTQEQSLQIQQLQDVCAQLSGVREMNEFLQMENELAREQMAESESTLSSNLQALRERNIQCEDMKMEISQLQLERSSVQDELEAVRARANAVQLKQDEELAQAVTEITLLNHTLRGVTNQLHGALEKPDAKNPPPALKVERHPSSSFVDCVMVALITEKDAAALTTTPVKAVAADSPESPSEAVFSGKSAFTRVGVTPKKKEEFEPEEEEQQSSALELLAHLSNTITELVSTLKTVQQCKDARVEELQSSVSSLEMALHFANSQHESEVFDLKHELNRVTTLMEKGKHALQQKAQDEKMVEKLIADVNEAHELVTKQKNDYNDLRKEAAELRRSLKETQTEAQFLRAELAKAGHQTDGDALFMDEKLKLLKEVDRLKTALQEAEKARGKLLERAKRHQMIHQMNQVKSEKELHMLNNMINKVREVLLCLPDVMKNSEHLQQILEYLG